MFSSFARRIAIAIAFLSWIAPAPKVGRGPSEELASYCSRHHISFDWMLGGCLIGLKRMTDERRGREMELTRAKRFAATYAQLSPEDQAIITAKLRRIMAERDQ
jgi:hypothetical protein